MKHSLKVNSEYWEPLCSGEKTFEVRRDDRGFQKGDTLLLRKWGPDWNTKRNGYLKGKDRVTESEADTIKMRVTWILTGGQFGIEPGFVVMGLEAPE